MASVIKLPDNFSDLYPNRFVHHDQLKGREVTLTIKSITVEELHGDKGPQFKVIMYFAESDKQYVTPKTVAVCLKKMFGDNPQLWVGKRVTLFPSTTKFGRETVGCIRVYGSPDIARDMKISIPQARKKPLEVTLKHVAIGQCGWTEKRAKAVGYVPPTASTSEPEEEQDEAPIASAIPSPDFSDLADGIVHTSVEDLPTNGDGIPDFGFMGEGE